MTKPYKVLHINETETEVDNWFHLNMNQDDITKNVEVLKEEQPFDVVLVQAPYSEAVKMVLECFSEPFNTLIEADHFDQQYQALSQQNHYYYQPIQAATQQALIEKVKTIAFSGQYGDKIVPRDIQINPSFKGTATYEGHPAISLKGDFGESFQPLLNWNTVLIADKEKATDIWPEFEIQGDVKLKYTFRVGDNGSVGHILETYTYTDDELKAPFTIPKKAFNTFVSVSIQAKGSGKVRIGAVHKRWSRLAYGDFIFGGARYADDKRQEFITFFHPGDMKPPLNVYFSGYRPAEGFEAYYMMKKLGAPFLLLGDPRIEGGAFYKGSEQYEKAITQTIKDTLRQLNFRPDDLIMSGLSMGSFGALYYSSVLNPRAVIVGKPLVNMGTIAQNMRLLRPNDFGTMLDVLLSNEHDNSEAAITHLNETFWRQLAEKDSSQTTFAIAYMQHDDYDPYAFDDLVAFLSQQQAKIISRGIPGRHNDDTPTIANWFTNFYRVLLNNEFGRELS